MRLPAAGAREAPALVRQQCADSGLRFVYVADSDEEVVLGTAGRRGRLKSRALPATRTRLPHATTVVGPQAVFPSP